MLDLSNCFKEDLHCPLARNNEVGKKNSKTFLSNIQILGDNNLPLPQSQLVPLQLDDLVQKKRIMA